MNQTLWTLGAEMDVQAIYERLEVLEEGMGDRFYGEVLADLKLLEAFPEIGSLVYGDRLRRVFVFNRNYGLYYVAEKSRLVIHALLDLRQDPDQIRRRLGRA
ncbi:hypothetical protein SAMN02745166_03379 [Prosthecobacter debontii]|uniref:Plasmid stabilization system protein ParE n=1 Tax=Prosthecobacter debontii TaxID=48467 RepID=A0A1T4YIG6_9BACT|nr:type II toxin-antitoxin system RelE/ParE family toxin [Prosthecobacter debontii]SKB01470.1 hypothetical protein SAMN02745166_03379 [Prosthecobacter debontii]